ncbi:hypothetical protein L226DRAFT_567206 [Lentinus tigrinus ALCF2SS1-7]|uniref:uncharacterized protein n=1 Tax=Lentinus tigrinus ALCF2SS1-7 TaxID=1328758 RepID=UPI0011663215|nr:hypothetical protein L226DRAFT_567206 [Lentinus tigrinus ALCF2SS1-7]
MSSSPSIERPRPGHSLSTFSPPSCTSAKFTRYEHTETVGPVCKVESTAALHDPAIHALELAHALALRNGLDNSILSTPGLPVAAEDVKAFMHPSSALATSWSSATSPVQRCVCSVKPMSTWTLLKLHVQNLPLPPDTSYPAGQSISGSLSIPVPVALLPVLGFINTSLSVSFSFSFSDSFSSSFSFSGSFSLPSSSSVPVSFSLTFILEIALVHSLRHMLFFSFSCMRSLSLGMEFAIFRFVLYTRAKPT